MWGEWMRCQRPRSRTRIPSWRRDSGQGASWADNDAAVVDSVHSAAPSCLRLYMAFAAKSTVELVCLAGCCVSFDNSKSLVA